METNFRTVKRYLGKALLTGVVVIGMAATSDEPARVHAILEGCVVSQDGWWSSWAGLYGVEVIANNQTMGETDVLGNFSVTFHVFEGSTETHTIFFKKEGYHDNQTIATVIGGSTVTLNNNIVMTEIE